MSVATMHSTPDLLRELAARCAQAVDRRDRDALLAVFHPSATLSVRPPVGSGQRARDLCGHQEISAITAALARYTRTFHFLGQASYETTAETATGEVYCLAHHLLPTPKGTVDHVMHIRYHAAIFPAPTAGGSRSARCSSTGRRPARSQAAKVPRMAEPLTGHRATSWTSLN